MLRKTRKLPEPERRFSGIENLRPSTPSEIKGLLMSDEAKSRSDGAWKARCIAELGDDLTAVSAALIAALRDEARTGSNPTARVYLTQAVACHARNGHDAEQFIRAVSLFMDDPNIHARYNAISAISAHGSNGGDIGIFTEQLIQKLGDIAQTVQEISLAALKAHASSGPLAAHHVLLALDGHLARGPSARERMDDLKAHCGRMLQERK